MADEQDEVVGNARDVFRTECEIDVSALTRITAFSDLTHNVVTKNPLRAGASKKTQV